MDFFRKHWFDIGGFLGIIILISLVFTFDKISNYQLLMWLSLVSLFFHQLEEYRIVGTFPDMINRVMFNSDLPDRFPLNTNTSLIINVGFGWTIYLVAAVVGEQYIWLGISSILISLGNIIAHTLIFNIKGKMLFNAGLVTSWLFFAPSVFFFFRIISNSNLTSEIDFLIGIPLGILINIFGVFKPIVWLSDRNTQYIFKKSQLFARDR